MRPPPGDTTSVTQEDKLQNMPTVPFGAYTWANGQQPQNIFSDHAAFVIERNIVDDGGLTRYASELCGQLPVARGRCWRPADATATGRTACNTNIGGGGAHACMVSAQACVVGSRRSFVGAVGVARGAL